MTGPLALPPMFSAPPLCAETDPEAFFPDKGGSTKAAKAICAGCEAREECLAWAVDHDERFGIWGGLSERERRRLRQQPTSDVVEPEPEAPPVPAPPPTRPPATASPRRVRAWTAAELRDAAALLAGHGLTFADTARQLGVSQAALGERPAGAEPGQPPAVVVEHLDRTRLVVPAPPGRRRTVGHGGQRR